MNRQEIIQLLEDTGWKRYPDQFREYAACMFKRFDTPTRCHFNDDKEGIQVCIAVSDHLANHASIEVDVSGELSNGTWIKLHNYAFGSDINKALAAVPRLLAAWETLNKFEA